jgi:hypothetical protein
VELEGGLRLYHQLSVDDQVQSLLRELMSFVKHRDGDFTRDSMLSL